LFPRLTRAAGFEWGTDIWVNPVSPESAARRLRDDS
jgi:UDPglucose--hexose-1-phosphate uridylyltransferase